MNTPVHSTGHEADFRGHHHGQPLTRQLPVI